VFRLSVALVVLLWVGGMTVGNSGKGGKERERNSCKWSDVIYWYWSCSDNYSSILNLSAFRFGIFASSR
jgi:hypothetical protein